MKRNVAVSSIMTSNVKSVQVGQQLSDVRKILSEESVHHVPVLDGTKVAGIITATDVMSVSFDAYGVDRRTVDSTLDHQFKLADVMQSDVLTVHKDDTVREAAKILSTGDFHSVLVVDHDRNLEGIVTSTDLIQFLAEL